MKLLATALFSFIAGIFAPISISFPKPILGKSALNAAHIDPVAMIFISIGLLGIFLLLKKRNRNRRG